MLTRIREYNLYKDSPVECLKTREVKYFPLHIIRTHNTVWQEKLAGIKFGGLASGGCKLKLADLKFGRSIYTCGRNRTLFLSICSGLQAIITLPTKVTKGSNVVCSNFNLSSKHTTNLGL